MTAELLAVDGMPLAVMPEQLEYPPAVVPGAVIDGQVVRVIEIEPYPQAVNALAPFTGRYVTDPAEIAAIRRRVEGDA